MGTSKERDGFFGKYTEHFDDDGNKVGESRERDGFFGKYVEHTDTNGNKTGESRDREGFFGDYTEHTNSSGSKVGESRDREGFFGDYTEHTDSEGKKIGESREREGVFENYTEHSGGFHPRYKSKNAGSSESSNKSSVVENNGSAYESSGYSSIGATGSASSNRAGSSVGAWVFFGLLVFSLLWLYSRYLETSKEEARAKEQMEQYISLATNSVHRRNFVQADKNFQLALDAARQMDSWIHKRVIELKNELYARVDIPANGTGWYRVKGSAFAVLWNPLGKCDETNNNCGYLFRSRDQSLLFPTQKGIMVRSEHVSETALVKGMSVSEIIPFDVRFCCVENDSNAAPNLIFRTMNGKLASVYIVRQ